MHAKLKKKTDRNDQEGKKQNPKSYSKNLTEKIK